MNAFPIVCRNAAISPTLIPTTMPATSPKTTCEDKLSRGLVLVDKFPLQATKETLFVGATGRSPLPPEVRRPQCSIAPTRLPRSWPRLRGTFEARHVSPGADVRPLLCFS
jgi:hypothetical protein